MENEASNENGIGIKLEETVKEKQKINIDALAFTKRKKGKQEI